MDKKNMTEYIKVNLPLTEQAISPVMERAYGCW